MRNGLSRASFSLMFGCKDVYAKPSIELCCEASELRRLLKRSDRSSTLVIAGWILSSSDPGSGAEGTAFNPEVSQNAFKLYAQRL